MKFGVEVQQRKLEKDIRIGTIILSRYSSSRLPGKALKTILGKPVLEYILERVLQVVPKDLIAIATSDEASDTPIAEFAKSQGIKCYRGSLENVSRRFYEAAKTLKCDYAVRINGDNIFLDTKVLADIIDRAKPNQYDFLSNVKNRTYPKGMSVEAVKVSYYKKWLPTIEADENFKEHVLLYLYNRENIDNHFYLMNTQIPSAAGIQLALDTQEDFERSSWMINNMTDPHTHYGLDEIIKLYTDYEQFAKR